MRGTQCVFTLFLVGLVGLLTTQAVVGVTIDGEQQQEMFQDAGIDNAHSTVVKRNLQAFDCPMELDSSSCGCTLKTNAILMDDMKCSQEVIETYTNAITVMADDLTLDLNGYGIYYQPRNQSGIAIYVGAQDVKNLVVTNGEIAGWFIGVEMGSFQDTGFITNNAAKHSETR